jgi:hypothetical protein
MITELKKVLDTISFYENIKLNIEVENLREIETINGDMIAGYFDVYSNTIYLEEIMVENIKLYKLITKKKLWDVFLHEIAHSKVLGHGKDFHRYLKQLKENYGFLEVRS